MDNWSWTVGVLGHGSENVRGVAAGAEVTGEAAIEAASDAAVMVAMDRGRQEYWISLAGTEMILTPGLTEGRCRPVGRSRRGALDRTPVLGLAGHERISRALMISVDRHGIKRGAKWRLSR